MNKVKRACIFYEYAGDRTEISLWSEIKIFLGKRLNTVISTNANDKTA